MLERLEELAKSAARFLYCSPEIVLDCLKSDDDLMVTERLL